MEKFLDWQVWLVGNDEYRIKYLKSKSKKRETIQTIPFSAFWLRSSVVSVLISLISDTWANGLHDIKFIFQWGRPVQVACY
uniref:Uncharacterized protein n=1 Tax=Populus trichocarpa TaxID=3694 RepID=A0A2K2BL11_POPTR